MGTYTTKKTMYKPAYKETLYHTLVNGNFDILDDAVLDSLFDANTILAADSDNTPAAVTIAEQRVVGRLTGGNITAVTIGIADNNIVQIDHASPADDDYAKFTANGLEGRSYAEVLGDLTGANLDVGAFDVRGQTVTADVAIGTAPLVITSTTVVANLNVDQVDGQDSTDILLVTNNLSDVGTAATAFANIKQAASDTATGVVERGASAETKTATDTTRYAALDDLGRTYTQKEIVAKGAGYFLDGVDDQFAHGADEADLDFGTTGDWYIEMEIMPLDVTRTTDYLINKEGGGIGWGLYLNEDDLYIRLDDNAHDVSAIIGTACFSDNVRAHIFVSFDRSGNATAYVNGLSVGTVDISSVTDTISSAGIMHIGNDTAGGNEFYGEVYFTRVGNLTQTAAEVLGYSNGAPVPYKYIGANQTDLIPNGTAWTGATGATPPNGWSAGIITGLHEIVDSGDGAPFDACLEFAVNAVPDATPLIDESVTVVIGKRYRWVGYFKKGTAANGRVRLGSTQGGSDYYKWDTLSYATWTKIEAEFTAVTATMWTRLRNMSSTSGETCLFDQVSLTKIGCVLQLEQPGIGHDQWIDVSGNELHGTTSGAIPINLGAQHTEKYVDLTVTGDTSFTLPKGYLITAIVLTSDGAIGGGIDIGTTDGGGEIVTAQAIAGAGTVLCTLVAGANYNTTGADDTIYITDADASGWDAATVAVRVEMQRVEP